MLKQKLIKNLVYWPGIIISSLVFGFYLQIVFAWSPPSNTPPDGNLEEPISGGANVQLKSGGLAIEGIFITDSDTYFATSSGSVGIGTTTPQEKLVLEGGNFLVHNGNIDSPSASIGSISASAINTTGNMQVGNSLNVGNGWDIGQSGIQSGGPVQASSTESLSFVEFHAISTSETCDSSSEGKIYFNETSNNHCFCNGGSWLPLTSSGGSCP